MSKLTVRLQNVAMERDGETLYVTLDAVVERPLDRITIISKLKEDKPNE